jgi:deoxyinosine 3'endonuclease (endonuclease V)
MSESESESKWKIEQQELKTSLILDVPDGLECRLEFIIGMDISLTKDTDHGVCTAVLLSYPKMQLLDTVTQPITITEPYIAGYLAFREVNHYEKVFRSLQSKHPTKVNKFKCVIITDGNGILHPFGFGLACHLGILIDMPTFGCGKNLHQYEELTYTKKEIKERMSQENLNQISITDKANNIHGYAVRGTNDNPVYVSQGHMISQKDMLDIVRHTLLMRVPEPIRLADIMSRQHIRPA